MDIAEIIILCAIIFIAWVSQAVLAGYIARKRGKTFWFWMVVAMLLIFPIGFIAMLIYTRDSEI
jgi:hypothetical protein